MGMRLAIIFLTMCLILGMMQIASADFDLGVEKTDKGSVVIIGLNNPAVFDLIIDNKGIGDTAEIYTLVGVSMTPKGTFYLPHGKSIIEARAYLGEGFLEHEGFYSFEYQIKGAEQGIFMDKLNVQVVALKDSLSIESIKIHPDDQKANLIVNNKINAYLDNVNIHFNSIFFDSTKQISLEPFGNASVSVAIEKSKTSRLAAGPYTLTAEVKVGNASVDYNGVINYLEKEKVTAGQKSSGFLIRETSITKVNEGNVPVSAVIEMKKDIISRLFTTYSIEPSEVKRGSLIVSYVWKKDLAPGDSFSASSTTNYTFIVVLIALIALIAFLVRTYSLTAIGLSKRVSFVRTKGGEFALRVRIKVKAHKAVDNIKVSDRLPAMAKLYEKFGGKMPDKVDEATRQLHWNIAHLSKSEERMFSYIVYSKLRTLGRFELPVARALFEREGKRQEVSSNRTFFVSETASEEN